MISGKDPGRSFEVGYPALLAESSSRYENVSIITTKVRKFKSDRLIFVTIVSEKPPLQLKQA